MQIISHAEKQALKLTQPRTRKTVLRRNLESLKPGEIGLFTNNGQDYTKYGQVHSAVHHIKKQTGAVYDIRELEDKSGMVVTRIS